MTKKKTIISVIIALVVLVAVGFSISSINAKKAESAALEQKIEKQKAAKAK